MSEWNTS